jgi:hypothetical protein
VERIYYRDGYEAGKAAGSWIIDGNTSSETAAHILRGIAECDPEVMDLQPSPLSGEWAGESIGELIDGYAELSEDEQNTVCDAYEAGYSDGFWAEVERSAKAVS